jgi:hypothetical protein
MYLQKVKSKKTQKLNNFFVAVLKITDENSRIRMDSRIWTKILRIRNTERNKDSFRIT